MYKIILISRLRCFLNVNNVDVKNYRRTYSAVFPHLWTASAFKGAFGERLFMPNLHRHYRYFLLLAFSLEIIISLLLFVNVCERSEFVPVTGRLSAGMTKQIRLEALAQTLQPLLNTARQKSIKIQLRLKRKKELRE